MGENLGEGARMDSRCYWDPESDGSAQAFFSNVSVCKGEMLSPAFTILTLDGKLIRLFVHDIGLSVVRGCGIRHLLLLIRGRGEGSFRW